jgi:hypothetical protein
MLIAYLVNKIIANCIRHAKTSLVKEKSPLVFKIDSELHARLEECSERTGIKKYTLGILAIEAAGKAIERNGYKLVVPIEFDVTEVPAKKPSSSSYRYPSHQDQDSLAEDRPAKKKPAA